MIKAIISINNWEKDKSEINTKIYLSKKNISKKLNLKREEEKNIIINNKKEQNHKGIRFEDYIIIGLLGTGSFGRVFKVKKKMI